MLTGKAITFFSVFVILSLENVKLRLVGRMSEDIYKLSRFL